MLLQRSFVHLPGIGASKERLLWSRGVDSWARLLTGIDAHFKGKRADEIRALLLASQTAWETRNALFFYQQFPRSELWRLVSEFRDDIAYLDIETNGLDLPPRSCSTTITFYFRGELYQEHQRAAKEKLLRKMDREALLFCSYYGEVFDIPFLRREFGLPLDKAHLDLCFWLKRLGFNGGLKRVEKYFENIHQRQFRDIGGLDAVRLWHMHERGRPGALEALLAYNAEDTLVLEGLLVHAYNMEIEKRPYLGLTPLTPQPRLELPTSVLPQVYGWLALPS